MNKSKRTLSLESFLNKVCDEAESYVGIGWDYSNESDDLMKIIEQARKILKNNQYEKK